MYRRPVVTTDGMTCTVGFIDLSLTRVYGLEAFKEFLERG
jgi:hypothetical protein